MGGKVATHGPSADAVGRTSVVDGDAHRAVAHPGIQSGHARLAGDHLPAAIPGAAPKVACKAIFQSVDGEPGLPTADDGAVL